MGDELDACTGWVWQLGHQSCQIWVASNCPTILHRDPLVGIFLQKRLQILADPCVICLKCEQLIRWLIAQL